jgi:hypothetical protein
VQQAGGVVGGVAPQQQAQQQQAQQQIPQLPSGTQSDDLKKNLRQVPAGGGGFGTRASLAASRVDTAVHFGFRYRFDQVGRLEVTPLAQGYLTVRGHRFGETEKLFPEENQGRVPAGTPVYIILPTQTAEVDIVFAAVPALADEDASAKKEDAVAKTKDARLKQSLPAGTVEDPSPSANSRVSVTLTVPKR